MQGQQLKFDIDCGMARRHVEAVHEGNDGWIALCTIPEDGKFTQHHYKYDDLIQALEFIEIDENMDCYFSVNSFYVPKRLLENVRQIRALYADIDCHHLTTAKAKHTIDDTILCFKIPNVEKQIPYPSLIVKTGRGLQLYWLIDDLPKQAVPLWQLVQDEITDRLRAVVEELKLNVKVDNVSDIARILRLSGTNNTKANKMASLEVQNSKKYRLDELTDDYFPTLKVLGEPKKKKPSQSVEKGRIHHLYNLYSLHYARLQDIVKLRELRQGDVGGDECRRRIVFLYRYWGCCYLQDTLQARELALEFNKGFTKPLPSKTVIRETESAEKAYFEWLSGEKVLINGQAYRKGYNYRNSTLIRWLEITPEEQREMHTIISTEEKYRRKNAKRTDRDSSGLTAKQRERLERDKRILAMHEQGLSNCEIARRVSITEGTVRYTLNKTRNF